MAGTGGGQAASNNDWEYIDEMASNEKGIEREKSISGLAADEESSLRLRAPISDPGEGPAAKSLNAGGVGAVALTA